ncbi:MAG: sodium-dependent transporter [Defluviitaleaceae bacterium]|nr:sodium-dependent transporter [Defluviitaleaceae bacterium]
MEKRENFSSRLSFIIVSVSCAVGLGNIWLMPYRAGTYGGAIYIFLVIAFILAFALPVLLAEYTVGRASGKSVAGHFQALQPKGTKWHWASYLMIAGNYILMMFYAVICGFALWYFIQAITGNLVMSNNAADSQAAFAAITRNPAITYFTTLAIIVGTIGACLLGLKNGVEKVSKYMMLIFFILVFILIGRGLTLPGAMEGLRFLFIPSVENFVEHGPLRLLHMSLGQAVFSVSVGMGSMAVFGSYVSKDKRLFKDGFSVAIIDIFVALVCLIMIFPAAMSFGIAPTQGEGLLFVVMPNLFYHMPASNLWAILFYTGLLFVSFSTAVAIVENIIAIGMDKFGLSRKKSVLLNGVILSILIIPGALGRNIWSSITVPGFPHLGSFFTFLVMELIMPIGALIYVLFITQKRGFGFKNFLKEVNTGSEGWEVPAAKSVSFYLTYVVPIVMIFILVFGLLQRFVL